jgi:hypothetical protein
MLTFYRGTLDQFRQVLSQPHYSISVDPGERNYAWRVEYVTPGQVPRMVFFATLDLGKSTNIRLTNCTRLLENSRVHYTSSAYVLIEQQITEQRRGVVWMLTHTVSYFMLTTSCLVAVMDARMKIDILRWPKGMGKALKPYAVQWALWYLASIGDQQSLAILQGQKKQVDISDALAQLVAWRTWWQNWSGTATCDAAGVVENRLRFW